MSPSTTRPVIDSPPTTFDWRSFPNYLSGPLTPATSTDPDQSPLHHSSSLPPPNPPPIAMSFPVQPTTYPYSFHDHHIPVHSHVPVNPPFSYPSPELDFQHILEMPIPIHDSADSNHPPLLSHPERDHDPILSPVSVNSFMTPCHSPVDIRSPLDYPTPTPLHSPLKGTLVHTILPSSFPENHVINFDVSVSLMSPLHPSPFPPFPPVSLSILRSLNFIAVHVIIRRTLSQSAQRRLSPRKRTHMRLRSSSHKSAPRSGVYSPLVSMSGASVVQKLALAAKNPPAIPKYEILVPVLSISLSKSRLSKRSYESTYRMSLSNSPHPPLLPRDSDVPDPLANIFVQRAATLIILSNL